MLTALSWKNRKYALPNDGKTSCTALINICSDTLPHVLIKLQVHKIGILGGFSSKAYWNWTYFNAILIECNLDISRVIHFLIQMPLLGRRGRYEASFVLFIFNHSSTFVAMMLCKISCWISCWNISKVVRHKIFCGEASIIRISLIVDFIISKYSKDKFNAIAL